MGYPSDQHIQDFIVGQKVKSAHGTKTGINIVFEGGEILTLQESSSLRVEGNTVKFEPVLIATPYKKDGSVKSTTEIREEMNPRVVVRRKYPEAEARKVNMNGLFYLFPNESKNETSIGSGKTKLAAWRDAASKI